MLLPFVFLCLVSSVLIIVVAVAFLLTWPRFVLLAGQTSRFLRTDSIAVIGVAMMLSMIVCGYVCGQKCMLAHAVHTAHASH